MLSAIFNLQTSNLLLIVISHMMVHSQGKTTGMYTMFFFVPVQHPEGFLSLAAVCVRKQSGGWKRVKRKNVDNMNDVQTQLQTLSAPESVCSD